MIYRIFPTKDTFLTSYRRYNVPQTGSNFGSSEILHLFKQVAVTSSQSPGLGRILMKFDVAEFSVTGSEFVSGSISYRLRLKDAQHDKTIPTSYAVQIQAVTQDWDEGRGHDTDTFRDKGFANWDKTKSNVWWSVTGSSGSGPISYMNFDRGQEDIDVDVTPIVDAWLTGGLANNGFLIRLSGTHETDANDYYIKMFHSRESFFPDRLPHLEARWQDFRTGSIATASDAGPFVVSVTNLKDEYETDETTRLRLYIRKRDYNPAVVLTASSDATGSAVHQAYWRITNDRTDEIVIPFGTGSDQSTRLPYDVQGNYFKLHMRSLPKGEVYRVAFLFDVDGQKLLIDNDFKFRIIG